MMVGTPDEIGRCFLRHFRMSDEQGSASLMNDGEALLTKPWPRLRSSSGALQLPAFRGRMPHVREHSSMIRWLIDPPLLTDAELIAEYRSDDPDAGQERRNALKAELERRGLTV